MTGHSLLGEIIALLALSVAAVVGFSRLRLPPIVGYLAVGTAVGPHALGWVSANEGLALFGEFGVAFLLFTLGLEFSLERFRAMRDTLLSLGGTQVLVGTLSGGIIAAGIGMDWRAAVVAGGALALSSTAIVVKQLSGQLELYGRHGQLALGVLLFQDLAAVPFIVLIPLLAPAVDGPVLMPVLVALLKGVVALTATLAAGRWLLRPLFHHVAAARQPEVFTLAGLLVALGAAWLTDALGLSLALGAFLAGLVLGETEYRHQIESDMRPFRDVLLGLFFATVGMHLDLVSVLPHWPWVLLIVLGVVVGKATVIALLVHAAGHGARIAVRTGIALGQGGEFGIALVVLATAQGLLSQTEGTLLVTATVLSMTIAPVLVRHNGALARWLVPLANGDGDQPVDDEGLRDHVLLCGYGRTGSLIGRILDEEGVSWSAVEADPQYVRAAWAEERKVVYGDARNHAILAAAGLAHARAVIITFDSLPAALAILAGVRTVRKDIPVLVRAREEQALDRLLGAGATAGVPEAFETGLMLALQALLFLQVPAGRARRRVVDIQRAQYPVLAGFFRSLDEHSPDSLAADEALHSIIVPAGAWAAEQRIETLALDECGITLVSVHRPGAGSLPPSPDLVIAPGDTLVAHANAVALARAERRILTGDARAG